MALPPDDSPADYALIMSVLAELRAEGLGAPHYTTVRRWADRRMVRAVVVGCRMLVHRDDVRRLVTPTPVGAV